MKRFKLIFFVVYVMILSLMPGCSVSEKENTNEYERESSEITDIKIDKKFPTLDTICAKLKEYSQTLGDVVEYGIIALSEEEAYILRSFLKENIEETESWAIASLQTILDDHEANFETPISYIDYCSYNDCKLILTRERKLIYVDTEIKKPIYITNSMDHSDNNYRLFEKGELEGSLGYQHGKPYDLYISSCASYTYCIDETKIEVQEWKFGENVYTWSKNIEEDSYKGAPKNIFWHVAPDIHMFTLSEHDFLCIYKDEIKFISSKVKDIVLIPWAENTLYYSTYNNEVHMLNISTLEDRVIATDFSEGLQGLKKKVIYYDIDGNECIITMYFNENNEIATDSNRKAEEYWEYIQSVLDSAGP